MFVLYSALVWKKKNTFKTALRKVNFSVTVNPYQTEDEFIKELGSIEAGVGNQIII